MTDPVVDALPGWAGLPLSGVPEVLAVTDQPSEHLVPLADGSYVLWTTLDELREGLRAGVLAHLNEAEAGMARNQPPGAALNGVRPELADVAAVLFVDDCDGVAAEWVTVDRTGDEWDFAIPMLDRAQDMVSASAADAGSSLLRRLVSTVRIDPSPTAETSVPAAIERGVRGDQVDRFLVVQSRVWDAAISELRCGKKTTHWMWWILPQLSALGQSPTSLAWGLEDLTAAQAFLAQPVLRDRLIAACGALMGLPDTVDIVDVLGDLDALKLRSCMTLFESADPRALIFGHVCDRFFDGARDPLTRRILRSTPSSGLRSPTTRENSHMASSDELDRPSNDHLQSTADLQEVIFTAAKVFEGLHAGRAVANRYLATGDTGSLSAGDRLLLADLHDAAVVVAAHSGPVSTGLAQAINAAISPTGALHPGQYRTASQQIGVSTVRGRHEPGPVTDESFAGLLTASAAGPPEAAAITLFLTIARAQPFEDGNKRTALLVANAHLRSSIPGRYLPAPFNEHDPTLADRFHTALAAIYHGSTETPARLLLQAALGGARRA